MVLSAHGKLELENLNHLPSIERDPPGPGAVSDNFSLYNSCGLSVLYASGYFVPALLPAGIYFLPSHSLARLIVLPSLALIALGIMGLFSAALIARVWLASWFSTACAVLSVSLLILIGIKVLTESTGRDWQDRIPRGHDLFVTDQWTRFIAFLIVLIVITYFRHSLPKIVRFLSSLGFALGFLAVIRIAIVETSAAESLAGLSVRSAVDSILVNSNSAKNEHPSSDAKPRRVVWVIFDEADYEVLFGRERPEPSQFLNFDRLANVSVFATEANSPASATLYSLPSLLTGAPVGGVDISSEGELTIRHNDEVIPFSQNRTIFGAVSELGKAASVLGFLHPYCKLFQLQRCDSFAWPEVGALGDVFWANIPGAFFRRLHHLDTWDLMTKDMLEALPEFVDRSDSLTFVHLDLPHLPAGLANRVLMLPGGSAPLSQYSHNLLLADHTLGVIMNELLKQTGRQDILLVVSSDHWLRNRWYQADVPEVSKRIPFMVWRVGESHGVSLGFPLSTFHTAAMILDYLSGAISTQEEVAGWWVKQSTVPSFIAPNT